MVKNNDKGFTLIELIVVIAIIAIVAAIVVPSYVGWIDTSKERVCKANRAVLLKAYNTYLVSNPEIDQDTGFKTFLDEDYGGSVVCPKDHSAYVWYAKTDSILCPYHDKLSAVSYNIVLTKAALTDTVGEIYTSFEAFSQIWLAKEGKLPSVNSTNGSLTWSSATYSGTIQSSLFSAKFWNEYYKYVSVTGFDSSNDDISDFKLFFKRDSNGNITSEIAGVYIQIGSARRIFFPDGTVVEDQHYSKYVDPTTKQLVQP